MNVKKIISTVFALVAISLGVTALATHAVPKALASAPQTALSGWAWSSNIGWISFNSTDPGANSSVTYKVTADMVSTGNMTGYAWSPNVGWISFTPSTYSITASSPCTTTSACQPKINLSTGQVTGFARALSFIGTGENGWIELSGTNHPYNSNGTGGVSYVSSSGKLVGYAWSPNIGWIGFNAVSGITGGVCIGSTCQVSNPLTQTLTVSTLGTGSGTVVSSPSGINCATGSNTNCSASFNSNSSVTLTEQATSGQFSGWGGACSGTSPTCAVTMSAAETVTATFGTGPAVPLSCSPSTTSSLVGDPVTWTASGGTSPYTWTGDSIPNGTTGTSITITYTTVGNKTAQVKDSSGGSFISCSPSTVNVNTNPIFTEF